jgi:GNAT superfamily N-acetyltransferase
MTQSETGAEVALREASVDDAEALVPLLSELGYPTDAGTLSGRLEAFVADPAVAVFVAERDDRLVGLASMHVMPLIEGPPIARLSAIVVTATERRTGVGRALVDRIESEALVRGCDRLELTTAERRIEAHAFYRSLGFESASRRFLKSLADDAG